jgi:hypothetical protein
MARLFQKMMGLVWLAPIVIALIGVQIASQMQGRRWPVHVGVFGSLLATLPAAVYLQGIIDPTTVEAPGPGDGFAVLAYFILMVPISISYSIFAWALSRKADRDRSS